MQSFDSVFKHMTHIGRSSLFTHDAIKPNLIYSELYLRFFLLFAGKNSFFLLLVVELEVFVSSLFVEEKLSVFTFPFLIWNNSNN